MKCVWQNASGSLPSLLIAVARQWEVVKDTKSPFVQNIKEKHKNEEKSMIAKNTKD